MLLEKNFIASAVSLRTISISYDLNAAQEQNIVQVDEKTGKYFIPAGSLYVNDGGSGSSIDSSTEQVTRAGIVLDDVYFKTGEETAIGSLIVAGHILNDRLPNPIPQESIYEFVTQGLFFEDSAVTVVPADNAEANPEE